MDMFYEVECKKCGKISKTVALKRFHINQPEFNIDIDIDLTEKIEEQYHFEIETPQGKATIDLGGMEIKIMCPKCKTNSMYVLKDLKTI